MGFADLDFNRLEQFKSRGFNPSCIFDIGASNGSWSQVISPLFPEAQFHLFEPMVEIEPTYEDKLKNVLKQKSNFTLHKVAVGKIDGKVSVFKGKKSIYGSSTIDTGNHNTDDIFEVPLVSLDSLIESSNISIPQLIKMDIQGGELEALKGCEKYLQHVDLLLLETWLSRGYGKKTPLLHEIINHLLPRGFYLFDFAGEYRNAQGRLFAPDVFFVNRNSQLVRDYRF